MYRVCMLLGRGSRGWDKVGGGGAACLRIGCDAPGIFDYIHIMCIILL